MILILENEGEKAEKAFGTAWERFVRPVVVVRTQSQAEGLIGILKGYYPIVFILDGELNPGCGTGMGFLQWLIANHYESIEMVQPNSASPFVNKDMAALCRKHDIKVGLPAQIGRKQ